MQNLNQSLTAIHAQRSSEAVWNSFNSAVRVLNTFRDTVNSAAGLTLSDDSLTPFYIFDPYTIQMPGEINPCTGNTDWETHSDFVLNIIRQSTGMRVEWAGPNNGRNKIRLYTEQLKQPEKKLPDPNIVNEIANEIANSVIKGLLEALAKGELIKKEVLK